MAYALHYTGSARSDFTDISLSGDFTITFRIKFDTMSGNQFILGSDNVTTTWCGWFNSNMITRVSGVNITIPTDPVADVWYDFTIERVGGTVTFSEPSLGSANGTQTANIPFNQIARFNARDDWTFQGLLERLTITGSSNIDWNPEFSDRSGSTDQPVLTDTIGSNDATGVNFSSFDPSVWVNTGGSGVNVTANFNVSSEQAASGTVVVDVNNTFINTISFSSGVSNTITSSLVSQVGNVLDNDTFNIVGVDSSSTVQSDISSSGITVIGITSTFNVDNSYGSINENIILANVSTATSSQQITQNIVAVEGNSDLDVDDSFNALLTVSTLGDITVTANFNTDNSFDTLMLNNIVSTGDVSSISGIDTNSKILIGNESSFDNSINSDIDIDSIVGTSVLTNILSTLDSNSNVDISSNSDLIVINNYNTLSQVSVDSDTNYFVNNNFSAFGFVGEFNPITSDTIVAYYVTTVMSVNQVQTTLNTPQVETTIKIIT